MLAIVAMLPLVVGFGAVRWPRRLRIPSESAATPPSAVLGVVWAAGYLMLGGLLWRQLRGGWRTAWQWATLAVLGIHLVATFAWAPLFAAGHRRAALYVILLVLATALVLQAMLINHDQLFVVLLAPYIAWLVFALHLNYEAVAAARGGG